MPLRVGLTPTLRISSSEPGVIRAATMKKAAEEISPGTKTSRPAVGVADKGNPAGKGAHIGAEIGAASVRCDRGTGAVRAPWSPSAYRPARSRADLTWALAMGER